MKIVEEWRQSWRWLSVQVPALNTAFLGTWALLPEKFQDSLPLPYVLGIAIALLVLGVAGRLIDQAPKAAS
jgi:hypothetical protein